MNLTTGITNFAFMFTGLIEEIGAIQTITDIPGGKKLFITAKTILDELKVDDSVSINGVCLTATEIKTNGFGVDAVGETLQKTTLAEIQMNLKVNLERALRLSDRLGGHLVQGHVNGIGKIAQIIPRGDNFYLEIYVPPNLSKYLVSEGSIAIDGISLTIAKMEESRIGLSVIPHTWQSTILCNKKIGDNVNIEVDVIAKYVEKLLTKSGIDKNEMFSDNWLKERGF